MFIHGVIMLTSFWRRWSDGNWILGIIPKWLQVSVFQVSELLYFSQYVYIYILERERECVYICIYIYIKYMISIQYTVWKQLLGFKIGLTIYIWDFQRYSHVSLYVLKFAYPIYSRMTNYIYIYRYHNLKLS